MNKFKTLCNLLENMKNPKEARVQIRDYLVNLYPQDQKIACNLMLASPLENISIGFNKRVVETILEKQYNYDKSTKYETLGDVCVKIPYLSNDLSLEDVNQIFITLSKTTKNKKMCLDKALMNFDNIEKKYFINILLNKLRIRIGMGVLSWSLAEIYYVDNKYVNNLYKKYESISNVIRILNGGSDEMKIGVPVKPMLAKDIAKYV